MNAVPLESLPLHVQAAHLRRHEPGKAVALDLTRSEADGGTPLVRMFVGWATDDAVTMAAARYWAQLAYDYLRTSGPGRTVRS